MYTNQLQLAGMDGRPGATKMYECECFDVFIIGHQHYARFCRSVFAVAMVIKVADWMEEKGERAGYV